MNKYFDGFLNPYWFYFRYGPHLLCFRSDAAVKKFIAEFESSSPDEDDIDFNYHFIHEFQHKYRQYKAYHNFLILNGQRDDIKRQ